MATKKKSSKRASKRRPKTAALSFKHVISAIEDMEARYRAFRPAGHQRKDKESALRLLGQIKIRLHRFCAPTGRPIEFVNIKNSLADSEG